MERETRLLRRLVETAMEQTADQLFSLDMTDADRDTIMAAVVESDAFREAARVPARFVHIDVDGEPVTQGSMAPKGSYVAHDNAGALAAWRDSVRVRGRLALRASRVAEPVPDCAIGLRAVFRLPRPKTVRRALPHVTPDLDKLLRAVGDGLQGEAYAQDSQITRIVAEKVYADHEPPGASLDLWRIGA